jgi:hypothetical protein
MSRLPLLLCLCLTSLLAGAPAAGAATLTAEGETLVYTAAVGDGLDDEAREPDQPSVQVSEPKPGTLEIVHAQDPLVDPLEALPPRCESDTDAASTICTGYRGIRIEGLGSDASVKVNADIDVEITGSPAATVDTGSGFNVVRTGAGSDTINPGSGNDAVHAGAGDDVVNTRDGYADRVDCGPGEDTANVDQLDTVVNCETVNVAHVPDPNHVPQDRQPTVRWLQPADNAQLLHNRRNQLRVDATDDNGVTRVEFYAGTRLLCVVEKAPYHCEFEPGEEDVGQTTLLAIAHDTAGQVGWAARGARMSRFRPLGFHAILERQAPKKKKQRSRYVVQGKMTLPRGVTRATGCGGFVTVSWRIASQTIATRNVKFGRNCGFSDRIRPKLGKKLRSAGRLRVVARFEGNAVLTQRSTTSNRVRIR